MFSYFIYFFYVLNLIRSFEFVAALVNYIPNCKRSLGHKLKTKHLFKKKKWIMIDCLIAAHKSRKAITKNLGLFESKHNCKLQPSARWYLHVNERFHSAFGVCFKLEWIWFTSLCLDTHPLFFIIIITVRKEKKNYFCVCVCVCKWMKGLSIHFRLLIWDRVKWFRAGVSATSPRRREDQQAYFSFNDRLLSYAPYFCFCFCFYRRSLVQTETTNGRIYDTKKNER